MAEKVSHKTNNKKYLYYIIALVLIVVGAWFVFALMSSDSVEAKATFKGQKVTVLSEDVQMLVEQASLQGVNVSRKDIAKQLITKEVLLVQAALVNITYTDEQIQTLADNQYAQLVASFGEENITLQLKTQNMTTDEFMVKLRKSLREDMMLQALINQEVFGKVAVSEEQLQQMYAQYQQSFSVPESASIKHILVCYTGAVGCEQNRSKDEANALISRLKDQLSKTSFELIASQFSSDTGSASNGGDLGVVYKGQTVEAFETAAFSAPIGQVVGPVESPYGYHLIKVYAKAAAGQLSYDQVRNDLKNQLISDQATQLQQAYIAGLMSSVDIRYFN